MDYGFEHTIFLAWLILALVSILVLMDYGFEPKYGELIERHDFSFNPCFNGLWVRTEDTLPKTFNAS